DVLRFWDARTGRELARQEGLSIGFAGLAWTSDGKGLLTAGAGGALTLLDGRGKVVRSFPGHTGEVVAVSLAPDGKTFATGGADGTVRLWDLQRGQQLKRMNASRLAINGVAWSPDGKTVASIAE